MSRYPELTMSGSAQTAWTSKRRDEPTKCNKIKNEASQEPIVIHMTHNILCISCQYRDMRYSRYFTFTPKRG
jgi:hypothetical protein